MKRWAGSTITTFLVVFLCFCSLQRNGSVIERINFSRGVCVVLGDTGIDLALQLARETELLIYLQFEDSKKAALARRLADEAGFYGNRIWIDEGSLARIHLADNLVDVLIAEGDAPAKLSESEALRVLCPRGKAIIGTDELSKPLPEGVDDWSHPFHGPDNNPQSRDQLARAPYLTQFLEKPYYAPLTQVAVASAGRIFKAFGNIAFHVREEALLNSLVAFNGYNGTMLWRRHLTPGVMIHRNTMIATPEVLYVADDKSCKRIDTASGHLIDEIIPSKEIAGGTFWKWMALENGVLYALVGAQEQRDPITRQHRQAHGWPWDPLTKGFNQEQNPWGFGRNLIAIEPESKRILWSHREDEAIDSRALCMKGGRIYIFRWGSFLASLNAANGKVNWRKTPESDPAVFEALGPYLNRQDWRTNWRTTSYLKCSEQALYFAGPQVSKLLALSADDGGVLWEHPYSNFQLVLRDDGLYGISGQIDEHPSLKFDPLSGRILATIDTRRRACARPNGTIDAILYRAEGGSVRLDTASEKPQWVSPMRAQCQDGVTVANGLLYWWPSVCDCQNTLYGLTCLGPAGDFEFDKEATVAERLRTETEGFTQVVPLAESDADWPTFRANNTRTATTDAVVSDDYKRLWWFNPETRFTPTAPVVAGGIAFIGGSDGIVRAFDMENGTVLWKAYTGGAIRFPPTVWKGRVFVGSGDGWMYAIEATSGHLLWRFNAAPAERKIPVYGSLISTWPVSSGVLVEDGIAYFAAGIVNYDGIHVYALDAVTGRIKWQNNTSGHLDPESRTGVSVQGHMLAYGGKLYLAGGTSVSPAVYDLSDGRCLNDPTPLKLIGSTSIRGQELYKVGDRIVAAGKPMYADPEFPVYDPTVSNRMLHTSVKGRDVIWSNGRRVMSYRKISEKLLNQSVAEPPQSPAYIIPGWGKLNIPQRPQWVYDFEGSVAFARCRNVVLLAGGRSDGAPQIEAVDLRNGRRYWKRGLSLQTLPVPWGMAVDAKGRIVASLQDGQIMCFGAGE